MFKYSDEYLEKLISDLFNGKVSETELPENLYHATADYLRAGLYKGFGIDFDKLTAQIAKGTGLFIESDLELLTELRENIYMFSAAKTFQQVKEMTEKLTNDSGTATPFNEFKKAAGEIFDTYNENYLKTEYNTAIGQGASAVKWTEIEKNKEVLPLLRYSTIGDACDICAPLDDLTAPVDDPIWDSVMPLNHFNCMCIVVQEEEDVKVTPTGEKDDIFDTVTGRMDDVFKMNAGKDGVVFNGDHPYFNVPKEYKDFAQKNFDLKIPKND
jgi:hypothetical protein